MSFKPVAGISQRDLLLRHFKTDPTITSLEAAGMYRIRDLPKRISELRAAGHRISVVYKSDPTGQRYAKYFYSGYAGTGERGFGSGPVPAFVGAA